MDRIDIDRLHQAIDELRKLMLQRFDRAELSTNELRQYTDGRLIELRQHMDSSIRELRQHMDNSISELRQQMDGSSSELRQQMDGSISELRRHTDNGLSELRKDVGHQMEAGFAEVRREASVNMRWMMGMWLTTIGFIAGLGGRVFGMY